MDIGKRMLEPLRKTFSRTEFRYSAVEQNDPLRNPTDIETNEKMASHPVITRPQSHRTRGRIFGVVLVMAILVFSSPLILLTGRYGHKAIPSSTQSSNDRTPLDCGKTYEEAQAKGCKFDVLDYAWIPGECYDEETATEFAQWLNSTKIDFGPFPFFEDMKAKTHVPDQIELSKRVGVEICAPQQEHRAHCVFTMRRYARMQKNPELRRVPISHDHLHHCINEVADALTGPAKWEKGHLGSSFYIGFSKC